MRRYDYLLMETKIKGGSGSLQKWYIKKCNLNKPQTQVFFKNLFLFHCNILQV